MRYFALLVLVGCAPPVVNITPQTPAPPPEPPATVAAPPEPPPASAPDPEPPPAANEQTRVLDSLFPKHLDSYAKCKKPKQEPATWVEVDDLVLKNLDAGQFVPVVEVRERVHAKDSTTDYEIRFVVRLENCQSQETAFKVEAFFTEYSLTPGSPADWRRPRAIRYREWNEAHGRTRIPSMGGDLD